MARSLRERTGHSHAWEWSGAVAAWQDMQLGVELSGLRIADVKVEVGDEVKRGDVLVTLDARTLDSELKMAEAAAQEAQAGILLATSQLDRGDALKSRKLISMSDHDLLRAAMVQAEARAATTSAQLDAALLPRYFAPLCLRTTPQPAVLPWPVPSTRSRPPPFKARPRTSGRSMAR